MAAPRRRSAAVLPRARAAGARALARARRLPRVAPPPRGRPPWVFYEGPPTANGRPGSHHVLARVFKDIYPRYKTMRGYYVERKGGWDCHGLPVEIAVEQQLGHRVQGTRSRPTGSRSSTQRCRESVFEFLEDWNALTERIGFWLDLDDAYRTLDATYIESVWWALRQICDKGLLYEGYKVVPYCPRCGTALSSHELALGYKDVVDPSVYVRFPVAEDGGPLQAGDELLVWTTTPVDAGLQRRGRRRPRAHLRAREGRATERAGRARRGARRAGARRGRRGPRPLPGRRARRRALRAAVPLHPADAYGERGHTVLLGDFVTADDGTGLVHTAIAFGEDDFRLGAAVRPRRRQPRAARRHLRRAHRALRGPLRQGRRPRPHRGPARARPAAARRGRYEHSYPHCWRCGTPLLYYAKPSWYIAHLAAARPPAGRQRDGRLAPRAHQARALRRLAGEQRRLGAVARALLGHAAAGVALRGRATSTASAPSTSSRSSRACASRTRTGPTSTTSASRARSAAARMQRVPEVIDVWFDSGAMPFAQ